MSKRKKPIRQLTNTVDIIDTLGGNADVADMLGAQATAVSNWRYFDLFPANTYVVLKHELQRRGYDAPSTLWAMIQPGAKRKRSKRKTSVRTAAAA